MQLPEYEAYTEYNAKEESGISDQLVRQAPHFLHRRLAARWMLTKPNATKWNSLCQERNPERLRRDA